ncbi:MAG: SDR family oxidoreductase [Anaerolineae bacterium]|jgi:NAD(P)-dependent dehydrogenase (short-subunit alcohol dehydrogenase family)
MSKSELEGRWALILGASSGFGAATALALAGAGMNIFGVHLDPKATLPRAQEVIGGIEALGRMTVFFNINAVDARKRAGALDKIEETLADDPADHIHFMLHSLAFGSLLPFIADDLDEAIGETQMDMTLRVMAHSLVYWVQDLARRGLLARGSRIYALSSGGAERAARHYGAVSAAKAALESHMRQLALELGPQGVAVNCLRPGVADTPASRIIPGYEHWREEALERNPHGRLTTPEDVANVLVALADPAVTWISGAVIPVDGGEFVTG